MTHKPDFLQLQVFYQNGINIFVSTEGAYRRPLTYDDYPIHSPHPCSEEGWGCLKIRWPYIPILGWEPKFRLNWTTLRCTTGPVLIGCILNIFALPCFGKLKPNLWGLAIFHKPSHTKGLWKIAKPPKYCFSFSKQGIAENDNFFCFFGFFFLGLPWKIFHLLFATKFFLTPPKV